MGHLAVKGNAVEGQNRGNIEHECHSTRGRNEALLATGIMSGSLSVRFADC